MGYTTTFGGAFIIEPPLNKHEVEYLKKLNNTRRMSRGKGPYYVDGTGFAGQDSEPDILDYNVPPEGQPSLWCQWTVSDDGTRIMWDEGEKAYCMDEWLAYIIEHFLKPGAVTSELEVIGSESWVNGSQFAHFTYDHVVSGTVTAAGEDPGDMWVLMVEDNVVHRGDSVINFFTPEGRALTAEETW
jgi:hypothetical protein